MTCYGELVLGTAVGTAQRRVLSLLHIVSALLDRDSASPTRLLPDGAEGASFHVAAAVCLGLCLSMSASVSLCVAAV